MDRNNSGLIGRQLFNCPRTAGWAALPYSPEPASRNRAPPMFSRSDLTGGFGSKPYASEELVAEITAAFVCAALSIAPTVRHADYLGHWLEVMRADNRAIFRAASKASKAADFILAFCQQAGGIASNGGTAP
jgi:antirestriction protein ArdC